MSSPSVWLPLALASALLPLVPGVFAAPVAAPTQDGAATVPILLSPGELALIGDYSPLPDLPADATNAVADDPAAALLGQALFYDTRLSSPGTVSCSTCHLPEKSWTDGRPLAKGVSETPRHAMTLWNVAYNRWFFWDGRKDSLWSQALAPFEDPREHAFSRLQVVNVVAADDALHHAYEDVFGPLPPLSDRNRFPPAGRPVPDSPDHPHNVAWLQMTPADQQLVDTAYANVGKSIAAFERRLVSRRAPFDVFVEGLTSGDPEQLRALSPAAQRGFGLFVGKGKCFLCHDGPTFSDLEFHSNRTPVGNLQDGGRAEGIQILKADPFNGAGGFADDEGRVARTKLSIAPKSLHFPGEFKTPTLRNVAVTAPYMHEGQMATLEEVIRFYSTMEGSLPPDPTGERFLQPREFTDQEAADLLAFLESLTDEALPPDLLGPPDSLAQGVRHR
jgi:cytochrome c peroxidase